MKQLEPTETEAFLSEVEVGQSVTGRVVEADARQAVVEVAPGVRGICVLQAPGVAQKGSPLGPDIGSVVAQDDAGIGLEGAMLRPSPMPKRTRF